MSDKDKKQVLQGERADPRRGLAVGILAGGRSRRMGMDKAFLELGGEALLVRACRRLAGVGEVLLVAGGAKERVLPTLPDFVRRVDDAVVAEGPMAGLLALLEGLPIGVDRLFLCACDLPFLGAGLVRSLDARLGDADCLIPRVAGRLQVLAGLYRVGLLGRVRGLMEAGERSLLELVRGCDARVLGEDEMAGLDASGLGFFNLNCVEDWREAQRVFAAGGLD